MKISMGIWGNTNLVDRFNVEGFGEFVPVLDRIKEVGETDGIDGIELHLPTEIDDSNADDIEKVLNDYGLQIVQLCGHTWTEKQYKFGALADWDVKVRANAIDRVKAALDMGARFNVPISVLWPATDGSDFPLQSDYLALYDRYVDSVRQYSNIYIPTIIRPKYVSNRNPSNPVRISSWGQLLKRYVSSMKSTIRISASTLISDTV